MVTKTKSDTPIKLIKNAGKVTPWQMPALDQSNAPSFRQPIEEVEEQEPENEEQVEAINADELQAIRDAAHQEGFQAGRQEGLASAQQQIAEQAELLQQLLDKLAEPISECGEKTQQALLELSFAIARQIVRRELRQDPSQMIAIIREALRLLPASAQDIVIALHPEDASVVKSALSINDAESPDDSWHIKADPSVERGSCQVNTEQSKVDASIDKQVAVLFSRVAGGQRAGESDDQ